MIAEKKRNKIWTTQHIKHTDLYSDSMDMVYIIDVCTLYVGVSVVSLYISYSQSYIYIY